MVETVQGDLELAVRTVQERKAGLESGGLESGGGGPGEGAGPEIDHHEQLGLFG